MVLHYDTLTSNFPIDLEPTFTKQESASTNSTVFVDGPLHTNDHFYQAMDLDTIDQQEKAQLIADQLQKDKQKITEEFRVLCDMTCRLTRRWQTKKSEVGSFDCSTIKSCFHESNDHMIQSETVNSEQAVMDLWNMVFKENIGRIVTLCLRITNKKYSDSKVYFPSAENPVFSMIPYVVELTAEWPMSPYLHIRQLKVTHTGLKKEKEVMHLHFKGWADYYAEPDPLSIKCLHDLLDQSARFIIAQQKKKQEFPLFQTQKLLIQCKQGIGRTGTAIALINLMIQVQLAWDDNIKFDEIKISPFSVVRRLLTQRWNLCESAQQYKFIYKFLKYYHAEHQKRAICKEQVQEMQLDAEIQCFPESEREAGRDTEEDDCSQTDEENLQSQFMS